MKRYMIVAIFEHGVPCVAFFDNIVNAQEYIQSLLKCVGTYFECYERRPHGSGKDYEWRYERERRMDGWRNESE